MWRPSARPATPRTRRSASPRSARRSTRKWDAKADCNPLWTAAAVPVAHATGARRRMRRYESKANGSSL
ncbi:hypothetical protein D3093_19515 (plasmid) [Azospirillum argentinense]|uniref:Uncharacterized protein n=1 Tax=Azospirillum argentinense TaxID=2970906 RepID=A0A4D8PFJ6_9PROT|nr:hypothetical protein D3093_19515 [Azospirillum argentinense]